MSSRCAWWSTGLGVLVTTALVTTVLVTTVLVVVAPAAAQEGEFQAYEESRSVTTQFGIQIMTPLWLREPDLNPGFGMQMRLGWELGPVTPEFNFGGMVNWVDVDTEVWGSPSEPLDTFWFGFGARYHVLNRSAIVPFVGAGAQVNLWGAMLWEEAYAVDDRYRPTLGVRATIGTIVELSRSFGIEFGVDGVVTSRANVFDRRPFYVMPFVGGTGYF